LESRLGRTLQT